MCGVAIVAVLSQVGPVWGFTLGAPRDSVEQLVQSHELKVLKSGGAEYVAGSLVLMPRTPKRVYLRFADDTLVGLTFAFYGVSDAELKSAFAALRSACTARYLEPTSSSTLSAAWRTEGLHVALDYFVDPLDFTARVELSYRLLR